MASSNVIDLTGKRFGKLTVIKRDMTKTGGAAYWICKCDCGNTCSKRRDYFTNTKGICSCGCEKPKRKIDTSSLIGKRFGRLVVISRDETKPIGHGKPSYWICKCDCGNTCSILYNSLISGSTKSCGCLRSALVSKNNTKDITNQRFGKVVAKERTNKKLRGCYLWRCECDCGNTEYYCNTTDLLSGKVNSCGCGANISHGEEKITKILENNNILFASQYRFADLKGKNNQYLRYDFAILDNNQMPIRLIEFDGEQHYNKKSHYYSEEGIQRDQMKNNYALSHNIPLIRIPYTELNNITLEMLLEDNTYLVKQL